MGVNAKNSLFIFSEDGHYADRSVKLFLFFFVLHYKYIHFLPTNINQLFSFLQVYLYTSTEAMDLIKQLSVHLVYLSPTDFNHLDESITQLLHSMIMNARRVSIVKGAALKLRIHNKCQVSTMGGKPNKLQCKLGHDWYTKLIIL